MQNCGICLWLEKINDSPYLIKEFTTGYAVLSKYQYYEGYTLFICKDHVTELNFLSPLKRRKFLDEMSQVAEAVYNAVKPDKLNYELLGNSEPHLHWHLIPRYKNEKEFHQPIWIVDKNIRQSDKTIPSLLEITRLKKKIYQNITSK